ncbi:UNVERIFIED_CONTAM: hypothetical protein HDU68_009068 [Siphonaria sp. JEL0065]|nr:hypothetical protein HDU68_009068 [Siphonaria sp. JEL0065]
MLLKHPRWTLEIAISTVIYVTNYLSLRSFQTDPPAFSTVRKIILCLKHQVGQTQSLITSKVQTCRFSKPHSRDLQVFIKPLFTGFSNSKGEAIYFIGNTFKDSDSRTSHKYFTSKLDFVKSGGCDAGQVESADKNSEMPFKMHSYEFPLKKSVGYVDASAVIIIVIPPWKEREGGGF